MRKLVLIFAVAGCAPSPEEACEKFAPAYCAKVSECVPYLFNTQFADVGSCVTRLKINCPAGFSAPGTVASTSRVVDCATQIMALSCDDLYAAKTPEACKPQAGQNANGVTCTGNEQCQSTWCAKPKDQACGTCGPKPSDGTNCTNQECGEGLQCVNNVCVTPGAAGAACDNTKPCRGGLACKAATPGGNTGTCAIALKQGEACQALLGPNNAGCDPTKGLFCHPTMAVCTPVVYAKVGEACGITGMMYAVCTASADCKMQKCVAPATDGAPCDATNGPGCLAPAKCVSGLCKLEDPAACK